MLVLTGAEDLSANLNQELGVSDWHEVTQESIDEFARVTGDDQWIHVDVDRAKESPFGGTIAHGNYTLSLGPKFSYRCSRSKVLRLLSTADSTKSGCLPRYRWALVSACVRR